MLTDAVSEFAAFSHDLVYTLDQICFFHLSSDRLVQLNFMFNKTKRIVNSIQISKTSTLSWNVQHHWRSLLKPFFYCLLIFHPNRLIIGVLGTRKNISISSKTKHIICWELTQNLSIRIKFRIAFDIFQFSKVFGEEKVLCWASLMAKMSNVDFTKKLCALGQLIRFAEVLNIFFFIIGEWRGGRHNEILNSVKTFVFNTSVFVSLGLELFSPSAVYFFRCKNLSCTKKKCKSRRPAAAWESFEFKLKVKKKLFQCQ